MQKIIGFYEDLLLFEQDEVYYLVRRHEEKILFKGDKEMAIKFFVMRIANFINDEMEIES